MDEAERKEKAKEKARAAAYRAAHPEEVKAKNAAYRAAHPEEEKARAVAYYAAHKEEAKARAAAYSAAHREEEKARKADYSRARPQPQRLHALRELAIARRSAGLCLCGAPARPDRTRCQRCTDEHCDRERLRRQAKRELAADPLFTELATTHTEPTPF